MVARAIHSGAMDSRGLISVGSGEGVKHRVACAADDEILDFNERRFEFWCMLARELSPTHVLATLGVYSTLAAADRSGLA